MRKIRSRFDRSAQIIALAFIGFVITFTVVVGPGSLKGTAYYKMNRMNNLRKIAECVLQAATDRLPPQTSMEEILKMSPNLEQTLQPIAPKVNATLSMYEIGRHPNELVCEGRRFPESTRGRYFAYYDPKMRIIRFGGNE